LIERDRAIGGREELMRSIEQVGATVEDATRLALAALGAAEDEVEVEVLESDGSEARVRVQMKGPDGENGQREDVGEVARTVLSEILAAMGIHAEVRRKAEVEGTLRLEVTGPDMGVVIGKHGSTINALQYLVGLIAHKRVGERVRVVVDAEDYRGRRERTLQELARTYARRVKETGQEAVLDALQSYERRIIHTALVDDPDVFTYSEGEEPDRRVVISPRLPAEGSGA
jgi:spoIIIJ-associated protein